MAFDPRDWQYLLKNAKMWAIMFLVLIIMSLLMFTQIFEDEYTKLSNRKFNNQVEILN